MKRVIIMRGIPGSGKSTQAKKYGGLVLSADNYFIGPDGVYRFNPARIGDAHTACMRGFLDAIELEHPIIVVDNTNTTLMELNPYRLVGLANGYSIEVVRVVCAAAKAAARNTHGVPFDTVMRMAKHFEDVPAFLGGETFVNT